MVNLLKEIRKRRTKEKLLRERSRILVVTGLWVLSLVASYFLFSLPVLLLLAIAVFSGGLAIDRNEMGIENLSQFHESVRKRHVNR